MRKIFFSTLHKSCAVPAVIMLITAQIACATPPTPAAVLKPQTVNPAAQTIKLPPAEAMVVLIRSSIVALSHANITNNYAVLNALGSTAFRTNNPPPRLATIFAAFRANAIDLTPVVYLSPQLTTSPKLENGRMRLVGYFPSEPMRVNFDLTFEPDQAIWKLYGLSVNLTPVEKVAISSNNNK